MSDVQAAILATTVVVMIGMFLLYKRGNRPKFGMVTGTHEILCSCARQRSRHFALKHVLFGMSGGQLLTDFQIDYMAGAVDEMMQIWAAKPDLTIVQASSHLIAIRLAAEQNLEAGEMHRRAKN